jgi:hypothetical protein
MGKNKQNPWFLTSALCLLIGFICGAIILFLTIRFYQPQISEIHQNPSQQYEFPGEVVIDLTRKGAYAIYYIKNKKSSSLQEWPQSMQCQLVNMKTGNSITLVPDYIPSDRLCSYTGECTGRLVYSTTVNHPGMHRFSCNYEKENTGQKFILAIGPNYVFEFFRLIWNMRWSILAIPCVLFIFSTTAIISITIALIKWKENQ